MPAATAFYFTMADEEVEEASPRWLWTGRVLSKTPPSPAKAKKPRRRWRRCGDRRAVHGAGGRRRRRWRRQRKGEGGERGAEKARGEEARGGAEEELEAALAEGGGGAAGGAAAPGGGGGGRMTDEQWTTQLRGSAVGLPRAERGGTRQTVPRRCRCSRSSRRAGAVGEEHEYADDANRFRTTSASCATASASRTSTTRRCGSRRNFHRQVQACRRRSSRAC